jgi:SAM-dependent methyltransferase
MDTLEKAKTMYFHRQHLKHHKEPWQHVGWSTKEAQYKRYEALCTIGDFDGKVVLDAGCGSGDFYSFIKNQNASVTYLGLDSLPEFIEAATNKYYGQADAFFIQADFTSDGLPKVDYVVASGALSYQTKNMLFPYSAIMKLYHVARCGVAFNLLDEDGFTSTEWLKAYNKEEVLMFCKRLATRAELVTNYQPDDFTILLYK